MGIQVSKEHYNFLSYVSFGRWCSYYKQIEYVLKSSAQRVMVIGIGDGIVIDMLKGISSNIDIIKVDFDMELDPDICTDVRELHRATVKAKCEKVDVILCCQVLEHLPFEYFEASIQELKKCLKTNGTLILSLPDRGFFVKMIVDFPKIHIDFRKKVCRFWEKVFFDKNGEHYWEINATHKYCEKKITKIIGKYFKINKIFHVENFAYHKFYVCEKI